MGNKLETVKEHYYKIEITEVIRTKIKVNDENTYKPKSNGHKNSSADAERFSPTEKRTRKKSRLAFDFTPQNINIAFYCKSLIALKFYGEKPSPLSSRYSSQEILNILPPTADEPLTLAECLSGLDDVIRSVGDTFSGYEEEFQFYLQGCLEARDRSQGENVWFRKKFRQDARRFIKIYKERGRVSENLTHEDFWGTRQQLLAGKVIADWVDPVYGPLDPVFGVLLNPTAGRTGPGDSGLVHKMLFDEDGPVAYHSAVHDGFGYLMTFHSQGPGYDYLGAWTLFGAKTSMSGQISGIKFWRETLKETTVIDEKEL